MAQEDVHIHGHAVEVRIYAEDPDNDFLPATGTLSFLTTPREDAHTRVDTGVQQGDVVSVYYDPMIAKLITWDESRDKALQRMDKALSDYRINGVTTNIDFLRKLASSQPFIAAELDTGFIEKHHAAIFRDQTVNSPREVALAALYLTLEQQQAVAQFHNANDPFSPWNQCSAWRMNAPNVCHFEIIHREKTIAVAVEILEPGNQQAESGQPYRIRFDEYDCDAGGQLEAHTLKSIINGYRSDVSVAKHNDAYTVFTADSSFQFSAVQPDFGDNDANTNQGGLTAPMNGTIVALLVEQGASVKQDDALLVMEAMKMEHTIRAPHDGVVEAFYYQPGQLVDGGAELLAFEESK